MRAFIARPFTPEFARVQEKLIAPALAALGIEGGTTEPILESGNIRVDMFHHLITADVVIVDVTLHNANVFYELGIRHALRSRATYLIRARLPKGGSKNKYPFDLQTERYLQYDPARPAASLDLLIEGLRQTLATDRTDSPVHFLAPGLKSVNPSRLIVVPATFGEDLLRARAKKSRGDLELFGEEVQGLHWEREGLRLVGRAQFELQHYEGARVTWEALRRLEPLDHEANTALGTIYQRLKLLEESNIALQRVTKDQSMKGLELAEALAQLARNQKDLWLAEWKDLPGEKRRAVALASPHLLQAADDYRRAFLADLNHYYSGINALGLYTVLAELGGALPDIWGTVYAKAERPLALEKVGQRREELAHAVHISIEAARTGRGEADPWVEPTAADLRCLTETDAAAVAATYRKALEGKPAFAVDAALRQLKIYRDLGVKTEIASASIARLEAIALPAAEKTDTRVLVFTGHRVDEPKRKKPRFPAKKEAAARAAIAAMVAERRAAGPARGLAGGASGGDILFHEVCAEAGIPTELLLALPPEKYVAASVAPSGQDWVQRFYQLAAKLPTRILSQEPELPPWLAGKKNYDFWERNNAWTLHHALSEGAAKVTLIALWDGAPAGDGPGGTAHMIKTARERGAFDRIIDTKTL